MENSRVTQITTPTGEVVDVIVINKAGVVVDPDAPCPDEELEEKAEEIAEEVVEEITEPEPKPEPKPAPKKPKKKVEVYKTTVETMGSDPFALTKLVQQANGKPVILDFQYDECGHC